MWLGQQRYSSKLMAWQLPADENMPKSGAFMKEMQFLMRQVAVEHEQTRSWSLLPTLRMEHIEECLVALEDVEGGLNNGRIYETDEMWPNKPTAFDAYTSVIGACFIAILLLALYFMPPPPNSSFSRSQQHDDL